MINHKQDNKAISSKLDEIIELLTSVNEVNWCTAFKQFQLQCNAIETPCDQASLQKEMIRIYGGMGSFSDLVLYDDGSLLVKENTQLENLRKELFVLLS